LAAFAGGLVLFVHSGFPRAADVALHLSGGGKPKPAPLADIIGGVAGAAVVVQKTLPCTRANVQTVAERQTGPVLGKTLGVHGGNGSG
jgi:hypothetical protein